MRGSLSYLALLLLVSACAMIGCQSEQPNTPPPDARRPVLRTEQELAVERAEQIEAGELVPTTSPAIGTPEQQRAPQRRLPPPVKPTPGSIEADVLMVNDEMLTVPELLFPLWDELKEERRTHTLEGFRRQARELTRREVQREIGSLLVFGEAFGLLAAEQKDLLDMAVGKQIESIVAREYDGSQARLELEVVRRGITMEQFRSRLRRDMVVSQYTREKLLPHVQVTRAELLAYYLEHPEEFSTEETRELQMMEFPFEAYLPEGRKWSETTRAAQARAKLQAMRDARAAYEALAERPFEDLAREYSKGLHAVDGGSWGLIARPLQPPFDQASRLIFDYEEGQTSEPLETDTGWFIVRCGRIEPATQRSFVEAQDEIRTQISDRRFSRLSMEYILELADQATISSLDRFLSAAVRKAEQITADSAPGLEGPPAR